jgi:plastocyanin
LKKLLAPLAVMALLAALAIVASTGSASSGSAGAKPAATKTVRVVDDAFRSGTARVRRRRTTVNSGDVIRFVWRNTSNPHNVHGIKGHRFTKPPANSSNPFPDEPGTTVSQRFRRDTTVVCDIHRATGMRLQVNVR